MALQFFCCPSPKSLALKAALSPARPLLFHLAPPCYASFFRRRAASVRSPAFSSQLSPSLLKSSRRSRRRHINQVDDDGDSGGEAPSPPTDDVSDLEELYDDVHSDIVLSNFDVDEPKAFSSLLKYKQRRSLAVKNPNVFSDSDEIAKGEPVAKCSIDSNKHDKEILPEKLTRTRYQKLKEDYDFDGRWFPLIEYLSTFGLKDSDLISIYNRHMSSFQLNIASAKERLDFLLSVGVKSKDVKRILVRQPQILEYTVSNLKSHISFLRSIGVPDDRISQVVVSCPSLFSYSVNQSLQPTIRYLIEEVGVKEKDVGKIVQLSPQILVQRLDSSWTARFVFFSKELGATKDCFVKMVSKHPQLLHYSIDDGILPRINFLRSIGMQNAEILKILTNLTQVLSLSLEGNLKPKYLYLVNELRNEVHMLTKYPMYLSLSLEQRIRPRHCFLLSLKKAPKGPFPLSCLVPTDERFCQHWAGTSLHNYLAFRESLLLDKSASKPARKRSSSTLS